MLFFRSISSSKFHSRRSILSSRQIKTLAPAPAPANKFNDTTHEFDLVVVGSGLVGAAMACALGKAPHLSHFKIALVDTSDLEAKPANDWSNRVVALSMSSIRVLEELDVWNRIPEKFKHPYQNMKIFNRSSDVSVNFHAGEHGRPCLGCIVDVPHLKSTLITSLQTSKIHLFPSSKLRALTYPDHTYGLPELHFNSDLRIPANLVIGADGIHSNVRQFSKISTFGSSYSQMGLVATVQVDAVTNETAWQRFLPTGPVALLPISDTHASLVWTLPNHLAASLSQLPSSEFVALLNAALTYPLEEALLMMENKMGMKLAEEVAWRDSVYEQQPGFDFSSFPPQILHLLDNSRACFPLSLQHAEKYAGTRTVLVGDAAHVIHPLAGQGLNLGLADVASLTRALDTAASLGQDFGDPLVLAQYTRDRYCKNAAMLTLCEGLSRVYSMTATPFVQLRQWGSKLFQSTADFKNMAIKCVSDWDHRLSKL